MNLIDPPINNPELLLLYLWKIIDLPAISLNNLLFKISYDLVLLPPDKANDFINLCLEKKLLVITQINELGLSHPLKAELNKWQKRRKDEINQNINTRKKILQLNRTLSKEKFTGFSEYLKSLLEKGTLNRAAQVKSDAFDIRELDFEKGYIKVYVSGSKEAPYIIEIDIKKKFLKHNCHDFETRRSKNKQFCKHITKFVLLLRDSHKASTEEFIKSLSENLKNWEFIS